MEILFGHSISQAPVLVQFPNPSSSILATMALARRAASIFPRLILRHAHTLEAAAGLISCPVLRSAAILFQPPARSATKKASTSNGSHAPAENERLCSFCIQKRPDSTNQHRSYHVRPRLSIIFLSNTVQKGGPAPFLLSLAASYTVPVTISSLTPGVTAHAPVTGSWVYVAAGTVICPAVVANRPVVPS